MKDVRWVRSCYSSWHLPFSREFAFSKTPPNEEGRTCPFCHLSNPVLYGYYLFHLLAQNNTEVKNRAALSLKNVSQANGIKQLITKICLQTVLKVEIDIAAGLDTIFGLSC